MVFSWLNTLLLLPLSALAAAAVLSHQTPDLSHIETHIEPKQTPINDLTGLLEQTALKQAAPIEIGENELNDYFARRLQAAQTGRSAKFASLERVLFDIEEGRCRVHFCWRVGKHLTVAAVDVGVQRTPRDFRVEVLSGAYGRLNLPRGFMAPLSPAMRHLALACKPEIDALFKMPHIRLAKDKLSLNPKF